MTELNSVLEYFINHEIEERLNHIELNSKNYINIKKSDLTNVDFIELRIKNKKISLLNAIIGNIKFNDVKVLEKLREVLKDINDGNAKMEDFVFHDLVQKNDYRFKDNYDLDANKINQIVTDNQVIILYPIIAKGNRKIPFISFSVEVIEGDLVVNSYNVQIDALRTIIANTLDIDMSEVDTYMEDFHAFYELISCIENKNIENIVELIETEIVGKFKNSFSKLCNFKNFGNWAVTEEIILTVESFGDMCFPPYQDEIEEVKYHMSKDSSELIKKYLFGNENQIESEDIQLCMHNGSYTSDYAINEKQAKVLAAYREADLLAVNGPPGTGKTTILKEIISDNFVRKTNELIKIWDKPWTEVGKENQKIYCSPLKGKCSYSMVIASGNNNAVDNIGTLLQEIPFFTQILDKEDENNIKGIFCARLGKFDNMKSFQSQILMPLITYLRKDDIYDEAVSLIHINKYQSIQHELEVLNEFITAYITKRKEVIQEIDTLNLFAINWNREDVETKQTEIIEEQDLLMKDKHNNEAIVISYKEKEKKRNEEILQKSANIQQYSRDLNNKQNIITKIESNLSKGFLGKFKASRLEKKHGNLEMLISELNHLEQDLEILKEVNEENRVENNKLKEERMRIEADIDIKELKLKTLVEQKNIIEKFYLLLSDFQQLQELGLTDLSWNASIDKLFNHMYITSKRNDLFKLSLSITEDYICKYREEMVFNLRKVYPDKWLQPFYKPTYRYDEGYTECLKGLWESMFLCFPVMTTTLFSFDRKKFPIIKEIFDTLLLDEAGQSAIHTAVTPLYRFRKAVIVGDVFQLEPIHKHNNLVIETSSIDEVYRPLLDINENSVQHAADRGSFAFDKLNGEHVGIVLNEHRRCEESIIAFSNENVYDNSLIMTKKDTEKKLLGSNFSMLDVRGRKSDKNTNEAELIMCEKVIEKLISLHGEEYQKEIGIITPYKNQAKELEKRFPNIESGTIHVFQGKEKEVIILSLVVDDTCKFSGVNFIGNKPNFMNVAFSRAKKQLILIGNYDTCVNANNYLSKAMQALIKHGTLYSLYEAIAFEKQTIKDIYMAQFLELFAEKSNKNQNELQQIIQNYSKEGIVLGAANHHQMLLRILPKVTKSLVIVSPWIRAGVVNKELIENFNDLCITDKNVQICFGYHKTDYTLSYIEDIVKRDNYGKGTDRDIEAITNLYKLLKDKLTYAPPIHSKIVIIDNEIMILGSHNWLSNGGKYKYAKEESSCVMYNKDAIDHILRRFFYTI